jgi:hypothetical protein
VRAIVVVVIAWLVALVAHRGRQGLLGLGPAASVLIDAEAARAAFCAGRDARRRP